MKRKKKYIQPVPGITKRKRALTFMSVLGLSLSTVVSFYPTSLGSIEEVRFSSPLAQSDLQVKNYSFVEEYDLNSSKNSDDSANTSREFSYFFSEEETSYVSIKNQKADVDVDAVLKEMEQEKAEKAKALKNNKKINVSNKSGQISDMSIPANIKFDKNGLPTNYSYCLEGPASAYCCGTYTATGTRVHEGSVAVDPNQIPYGKTMYIVSLDGSYVYGYCRAEDTGGFVYNGSGRIADLYMNSYDDCLNFGVRGVRIYVF